MAEICEEIAGRQEKALIFTQFREMTEPLVDPLICTKCGGQMRIKAFITAQSEIEQLCKNLGIISWRAPLTFAKTPSDLAA